MSEESELDKAKSIEKLALVYNEAVSNAATEFVSHIGKTLLNWKGVECKVIFDPTLNKFAYYQGGPVVTAIISFGPEEKNFKRLLFDVAKNASRFWNPVEEPNGYKLIKSKGDKIRSKKGELEILVPLKYCSVSKTHSITVKGPGNVSITISDDSGLRLESEMLLEARIKLSRLIQWENEEEK